MKWWQSPVLQWWSAVYVVLIAAGWLRTRFFMKKLRLIEKKVGDIEKILHRIEMKPEE